MTKINRTSQILINQLKVILINKTNKKCLVLNKKAQNKILTPRLIKKITWNKQKKIIPQESHLSKVLNQAKL